MSERSGEETKREEREQPHIERCPEGSLFSDGELTEAHEILKEVMEKLGTMEPTD